MSGLPLGPADIRRAERRLRDIAVVTPVLSQPALDYSAGRRVVCKAEPLQRTGSFKFRGAYNAVAALTQRARRRGVVGASSGNHAQALARAGRLLSTEVTVVVPHDAPSSKIDAARSLGARIVTYQRGTQDRDELTARLAQDRAFTIVPSANSPEVIAGAGTTALEFLAQEPGITSLLVPVGGGGLAAGTAMAARCTGSNVKVIGVEPTGGADTAASLRADRIVQLATPPDTIADGLRHTRPAAIPWEVNRRLLDGVVTVTDTQIVQAMRCAFDYLNVVVEPSGAVALAAAAHCDLPPGPVGVILSGGSIAVREFHQIVENAAAADGPDRQRPPRGQSIIVP